MKVSAILRAVLDDLGLSAAEENFLQNAATANTAEMNQSRIIADFYLAKRLTEMVDDIIESNKALAVANTKYAKGLLWLTGGLVFVGFVQIIIQISAS